MAGVQGGCHRCAGVLYVITVVFLSASSVKCYRLEGRINTAQNWKLMTWLCLKDSARLNFEFQYPKDCTERVNVLPSNNNQIIELSNNTCSTVTTDTGQPYYYCPLERIIRSSKPRRWHFVLARCGDSESGETGLRAKYTLNTTDTAISNCSVSPECPVSREEDGVLTCTCDNILKFLQGGLGSAPTGNGTGPANTENPSDSCHVMATGHTGVVTYTLLHAGKACFGTPVIECGGAFHIEGHSLRCVCYPSAASVEADDISWPGHSSDNTVVIDTVTRDHNLLVLTCEVVVGDVTSTADYTVHVAYGPSDSTTSIDGPSPFPTDGSLPMTLTCQTTDVNPEPSITWSGIQCENAVHNDQEICVYTPKMADEGRVVTCRATNVHGPGQGSAEFTIHLTSLGEPCFGTPVIDCGGAFHTEGNSLRCDCYPFDASVEADDISWPGHSPTETVYIDTVTRDHNLQVLTCKVVVGGVTYTADYTIRVAYGPSDSTTSIDGPSPFPTDGSLPMTLTCLTTDVNPEPSITWSGIQCENAVNNDQETCVYTPKMADEGQVVTCRATNVYGLVQGSAEFTIHLTSLALQSASERDKGTFTMAPTAVFCGVLMLAVSAGAVRLQGELTSENDFKMLGSFCFEPEVGYFDYHVMYPKSCHGRMNMNDGMMALSPENGCKEVYSEGEMHYNCTGKMDIRSNYPRHWYFALARCEMSDGGMYGLRLSKYNLHMVNGMDTMTASAGTNMAAVFTLLLTQVFVAFFCVVRH
ncbi:hypothetical protein BaRGS_00038894 [Batillaria attramentaria]|uniref:Ig-like domain-containing protein n=1 Tax=Batillaria attramentaria TaxID=370345 RepID=A0ABD0J5N5_9CAEN